jgi:hypothetical protein
MRLEIADEALKVERVQENPVANEPYGYVDRRHQIWM